MPFTLKHKWSVLSIIAVVLLCTLVVMLPLGCSKKKTDNPVVAEIIADETPPEISIHDDNKDGDTVTTSGIVLMGSATDDGGIYNVTVNNNPAAVSGSDWSYEVNGLQEGENTFIIEVKDSSKNESDTTITIYYKSDFPDFTIVGYTSTVTDTVSSSAINFTVTASDSNGIKYVMVNGDTALLNGTNYTWSGVLVAGDNEITFTVADSLDKISTKVLDIFYSQQSAEGLAKISGTLTQESESAGKYGGAAKMAKNAAGQSHMVTATLPVSGADILVYDADDTSTASVAHTQTDANGEWAVDSLEEGNYFIFAVFFDFASKAIKTAAIQNVEAVVDSEITTGEQVAAVDEESPAVMSFLDALSADSANVFYGSPMSKNFPVVITFSEPMDRGTAGNVAMGTATVDTNGVTFVDSVRIKKVWNGASTELRMIPESPLDTNTNYVVIIPRSLKDLAFNGLTTNYKGMFKTLSQEAEDELSFEVISSFPKNGDTIGIGVNPAIYFSLPADFISVKQNVTITPAVDGYFEACGNKMLFVPKMLDLGTTYIMKVPTAVKSLGGDTLTEKFQLTFTTKSADQIASDTGSIEGKLKMRVSKALDAYLAGDIITFASYFDEEFKDIRNEDGATFTLSKSEFIEQMKQDIAMQTQYRETGFLNSKWYLIVDANGDSMSCWKIISGGDTLYMEQMMGGNMNRPPKVFSDMNGTEVPVEDLEYDRNGAPNFTYNGNVFRFAPDFTKTSVGSSVKEKDPNFFGRLLAEETDVEVTRYREDRRESYEIVDVEMGTGDTAVVSFKMRSVGVWVDGLMPFPPAQMAGIDSENVHVELMVLKLVKRTDDYYVLRATGRTLYDSWDESFKDQNENDVVHTSDFDASGDMFHEPDGIDLRQPSQDAEVYGFPFTFRWTKVENAVGYMICIAEDDRFVGQPPAGLLVYSEGAGDTSITITENAAVSDMNATVLNMRPWELNLPMPHVEFKLDTLVDSSNMVYVWKVIAVDDSLATIISNRMARIRADSDFGPMRGWGTFALGEFPDWTDSDGDGYPDDVELQMGTLPNDPNSFPMMHNAFDASQGAFVTNEIGVDLTIFVNDDGDTIYEYFDPGMATRKQMTATIQGPMYTLVGEDPGMPGDSIKLKLALSEGTLLTGDMMHKIRKFNENDPENPWNNIGTAKFTKTDGSTIIGNWQGSIAMENMAGDPNMNMPMGTVTPFMGGAATIKQMIIDKNIDTLEIMLHMHGFISDIDTANFVDSALCENCGGDYVLYLQNDTAYVVMGTQFGMPDITPQNYLAVEEGYIHGFGQQTFNYNQPVGMSWYEGGLENFKTFVDPNLEFNADDTIYVYHRWNNQVLKVPYDTAHIKPVDELADDMSTDVWKTSNRLAVVMVGEYGVPDDQFFGPHFCVLQGDPNAPSIPDMEQINHIPEMQNAFIVEFPPPEFMVDFASLPNMGHMTGPMPYIGDAQNIRDLLNQGYGVVANMPGSDTPEDLGAVTADDVELFEDPMKGESFVVINQGVATYMVLDDGEGGVQLYDGNNIVTEWFGDDGGSGNGSGGEPPMGLSDTPLDSSRTEDVKTLLNGSIGVIPYNYQSQTYLPVFNNLNSNNVSAGYDNETNQGIVIVAVSQQEWYFVAMDQNDEPLIDGGGNLVVLVPPQDGGGI